MSTNLEQMQLAVILQRRTLPLLDEHTAQEGNMADATIPLNENEAIVLLSGDTVAKLLSIARAGDTRLDDIIRRIAT